jgi:ABC-type amino acid transport substrate-binding protein
VALKRDLRRGLAPRGGRHVDHKVARLVLTQLELRDGAGAFRMLPGDFSFEPYGLVLPRADADFRLAVNRALVALYKQGEIDPIYQRWLAPLGQPGPLLHAMFYLNALPD